MPERLKGSCEFGATIPTGAYQNVKISFSKEFYLDETTHEKVILELALKVDEYTAKLRRQELAR